LVLRLAMARPDTVHSTDGSITQRLAGRPGAIGPPCWSAMPAIAAGFHDSSASTSLIDRSSRPSASASAVSSPSIPGGAWSNGASFDSAVCGA